MVVKRRAMKRAALLAVFAALGPAPLLAQQAPDPAPAAGPPAALGAAPAPFRPDAVEGQPDVWIFSGELQNSHESFSGTLVAAKGGEGGKAGGEGAKTDKTDKGDRGGATAQFELKLAGGATCDGSDMSGEVGLVRLNEITCSDDRVMRALFVPQGGSELKVFGHVGDERFVASAHLLGTEPVPEKGQSAQPTAPKVQGPATQGPASQPPEGAPR